MGSLPQPFGYWHIGSICVRHYFPKILDSDLWNVIFTIWPLQWGQFRHPDDAGHNGHLRGEQAGQGDRPDRNTAGGGEGPGPDLPLQPLLPQRPSNGPGPMGALQLLYLRRDASLPYRWWCCWWWWCLLSTVYWAKLLSMHNSWISNSFLEN